MGEEMRGGKGMEWVGERVEGSVKWERRGRGTGTI